MHAGRQVKDRLTSSQALKQREADGQTDRRPMAKQAESHRLDITYIGKGQERHLVTGLLTMA